MATALTIPRLLHKMAQVESSDLHIKVGCPPVLRIASRLHRLESPNLTEEDTEHLLLPLVPEYLRPRLTTEGGVDFAHYEEGGGRFRCSVFRAGGGLHAAIRRVNPQIPDFAQLRLPPIYEKLTGATHEGLVMICGVTGSGKSSTLAAMLDHINRTRQVNILTIEDPVEYAFHPKMSYVSQREIGIDVPNFPTALRAAVRQNPDVIMIGEMRDRETMMAGIQAAETGHLVFVTLHCSDVTQVFSRIIEFFPANEHTYIRAALAATVRAVTAQRLVPSLRPEVQRVPATEVLLNNVTVSEMVRDGADEDLPAVIAGSIEEGMHDFTYSLYRLVQDGWIDMKIAENYAPNAEVLRARVRGIEVKSDVLVSKKLR